MISKKLLSILLIVLLLANLVLVGTGVYGHLVFWIVLVVLAVASYVVLKKI